MPLSLLNMDESTTFDMKTIEQLEQEKADILAKANALVDACEQGDHRKMKAAIEALKPEPERLRAFANVYPNGIKHWFDDSEEAKERATKDAIRTAVPMIEIRPIGEVPTWEEWVSRGLNDRIITSASKDIGIALDSDEARRINKAHNAEMHRLQSFINQLLAERGEA